MFPRAAKHLENAKQLVNTQILLPKVRKSETRQQTQLSNGRGGVALLQEKDFAKTYVQMCLPALLHGRFQEHDQSSCFTFPGFSSASSLLMSVSSESLLCTALANINKHLCYRVFPALVLALPAGVKRQSHGLAQRTGRSPLQGILQTIHRAIFSWTLASGIQQRAR